MHKFYLPILAGSLALSGTAQPVVDITMADNGNNQLEIRLRPNGSFANIVSNVVFTLRWQEELGPALSLIQPVYPASEYLPLGQSAIINGGNGYLYRTFTSVSLSPLSDFGVSWEGGIEYPLCTIDVLAPGVDVFLGNDAYTAANNRNFYLSLNGVNRTGTVFESPRPTVNAMAVNSGNGYIDVLLTPGTDFFGWVNSVDFTLRWTAGATLGEVWQDENVSENLPIAKVGVPTTIDGFTYQRFHGTGASSLAVAALGWTANEDHLLIRLPVSGNPGEPVVANDSWTQANEGTYSIFLNGYQQAGETDDLSTDIVIPFSDVVTNMHVQGDQLNLTLASGPEGMVLIQVINSSGQFMAKLRAKWGTTPSISMAGWAAGIYTLRITTDFGYTARRFVR